MNPPSSRQYPFGAELHPAGVDFRVHATAARRVELELDGRRIPMERLDARTLGVFVPSAEAGARYAYRLDGGDPLPDPASRYQPDGPHAASCVVDRSFAWTDEGWAGVPSGRQVIYELHVGTFTPERTWRTAAEQLDELAELGVTAIELMPVAEFAGRSGWGYDGVHLFAPHHAYGTPADAKAFVDRAHALGLAVLLDVVYNHLGPDGNYLPQFIPEFLSRRHRTDWGACPNFDDAGSDLVRAFVLGNVAYWIGEYHMDGLRVDATQDIFDDSSPHILQEIACTAHAAGSTRRVFVTAENEPQNPVLLRPPDRDGYGFDALWNDDFHHSARVALTGRNEAYYQDYRGTPQELVALVTRGWLYQGQYYAWQRKRRGTAAPDIRPHQLVAYLQNHDQVANSLRGDRLTKLTDTGSLRALTALLLLGPSHALLFQGQEYGAPQPFLYFADHAGELGERVAQGRHDFLQQFESIAAAGAAALADPRAPETLEASTLDPQQRHRDEHAEWLRLHRDLITLARTDDVLRDTAPEAGVLGGRALALRWYGASDDRLLLINLGARMRRSSIAEPLLAPPPAREWMLQWSSNDVAYGGPGTPPVESRRGWNIPARAAVLLAPRPRMQSETEVTDG